MADSFRKQTFQGGAMAGLGEHITAMVRSHVIRAEDCLGVAAVTMPLAVILGPSKRGKR